MKQQASWRIRMPETKGSTIRTLAPGALLGALGAVCWVVCVANGCTSNSDGSGALPSTGGASTGGTSSVDPATGGVGAIGGACSPPATRTELHPGDYDYESCSACHTDWWGGWLYNNRAGDAWVAGATVTITNDDGSQLSAITEQEGFFFLEGTFGATFTPCVSKCPHTLCATEVHTSSDCQTPACHGGKDRLIYLPQDPPAQTTGGSTGSGCTPPASGGPRVHSARLYDKSENDCRICHDATYTGGYVYDGLTSNAAVSMATVTITPASGAPITAVTGPGGMFFLGDLGPPSVRIPLVAPYTACVSKCPNTLCSATHTTTDDCSTAGCHDARLRIYLP
ncbi:MAG: hypothetical protein JW940_29680 [Polyangiaceae bacterium]|nr:hypothetical protein [Polyangiaceae bacterium]